MRSKKITGVFALVTLGLASCLAGCGDEEAVFDFQTHTTRKGDLRIFVRQKGQIESKDPERVLNPLMGYSSTLLNLVPEGTMVKKGDFLFELDVSEFEDERLEQEIQTSNAEQSYHNAKQQLEIQRAQNESDIKKGELTVLFAEMDLKQYVEGDLPSQLDTVKAEITLAEEELKRADDTLAWSHKLFAKGYISNDRLESDKLSVKRKGLDEALSRQKLHVLKKFTAVKKQRELTSNLEEARRELERIKIRAQAAESQQMADTEHQRQKKDLEDKTLARMNYQIAHSKVLSPCEGVVVYGREGRGRDSRPIEPGSKVREGQMIVAIPDMTEVIVEVGIHESSVELVSVGMPVIVTTDTGEALHGTVETIATVPDSQSWYRNPDLKVYTATVTVRNESGSLRQGMNCYAEIVIDELKDIVSIPVQAAHSNGFRTFCYLKNGDGASELREIETGLHNNSMVHVTRGVVEGDEVYLAIPNDSDPIPVEKARVVRIPERPKSAGAGAEAARRKPAGREGGREGGRGRAGAMTPEMIEKFKKMSPEERKAAMEKMRGAQNRGGAQRGGRRGAVVNE